MAPLAGLVSADSPSPRCPLTLDYGACIPADHYLTTHDWMHIIDNKREIVLKE